MNLFGTILIAFALCFGGSEKNSPLVQEQFVEKVVNIEKSTELAEPKYYWQSYGTARYNEDIAVEIMYRLNNSNVEFQLRSKSAYTLYSCGFERVKIYQSGSPRSFSVWGLTTLGSRKTKWLGDIEARKPSNISIGKFKFKLNYGDASFKRAGIY
ncbi:MAG: hypothetical protein MRZ79_16190 [Bacteroidia bacterium]|nr:hypothetical protein [Bacteroidia bacterium]